MENKKIKIYKVVKEEKGYSWDRLTDEKPDKNPVIASPKERFDYYIKQSFISGYPYLPGKDLSKFIDKEECFGREIARYKRIYDRYFSAKIDILNCLSKTIQNYYYNGKGNELTNGKFYSVGSSSRLAVSSFSSFIKENDTIELLNEIKIENKPKSVTIELEKDLSVLNKDSNKVISHPQMDVFFTTNDNKKYYIEVKCHEILDSHKKIKLRSEYCNAKYFNDLFLSGLPNFDNETETFLSCGKNLLTAKDFGCEIDISHFDFKQFICHLLGILNDKKPNEEVHFYYLFYKNKEFPEGEKLYYKLEEEMNEIIRKYGDFFKSHRIDFGYFFNERFERIQEISLEKNSGL